MPDTSIDLAIIGAGPHALTLVTHLFQKKKSMRGRLQVFDPSGVWMQRWQHQFGALEIPHLRSPAVHHPDPDPHALRSFAENRPQELFPPYDLPGKQLFWDFCQATIDRWQLDDCIYPAGVVSIEPIGERCHPQFSLTLTTGERVIARRVVIANGGAKPYLPEWVGQISTSYPPDRLLHSHQIDLRQLPIANERIAIVGGGLTSGHLALGAIDRGAKVSLLARRDIYAKLFDADPGWIGPKYLKDFWAEPDWQTRWHQIQQARNGGSMTPSILDRLRHYEREGKIDFYECCEISAASWCERGWQLDCQHSPQHACIHHQSFDRLWLATGSSLDARLHPLLANVLAAHPIEIVNGLPVLDRHLRWQGCELFVMGGLAALQVGPAARNLAGARAASDRIVPALIKASHRFARASVRTIATAGAS